MAPRLPADVAIHWSSVGWPVWLLCTSITVSVFSVIALFAYTRTQAAEDERRRRRTPKQQSTAAYDVMWSFPEKEDKAARFKRWAEVLRFKPREARPPISSVGARLDVKVALDVFYREAEAAGIMASAGNGAALPSSPRHEAVSIPECEVAAALREKVKDRILQFLIECGPPKGLISIVEEDRSVSNTPSMPSTPRHNQASQSSSHAVDMRKLIEAAAEAASAPSTPRAASRSLSSPRPPAALALDGEPVLRTEAGETVTRELLWAVLARIHAEAQASATNAESAAHAALPLPADVVGGIDSSADGNLRQPLLGEWKNPLQA